MRDPLIMVNGGAIIYRIITRIRRGEELAIGLVGYDIHRVYSYQTESWFMELNAKCGGKDFPPKGNMPFTETPNVGNQHQYDLRLTLPSADAGTDDALFAQPTGDADVDGQMDKLASEIDASGTPDGQNVPLEVVRSFGTIIGILSHTFFGA